MNKDKYISLLYKKLKGAISLEEQSLLDVWISTATENEQLAKEIESDWQLTADYEPQLNLEVDVAADFKQLQQRILEAANFKDSVVDNLRVAHQPIGKVVAMKGKKTSRSWINWAAAAVVVLAVGLWFLTGNDTNTVSKITATTQFGEKQSIELADGTKIRLNGNSQLIYPSAFEEDSRLVKLSGEAFFEVAKNAQRPFVIETNKTKVTVLGTSFNVRALMAEEETEVAVKTGKVQLENLEGTKKVELIPNQVGIYDVSNDKITKATIKNLNQLAWHNDILVFSDTPISEVLATLSKQYEVVIALNNSKMNACKWTVRWKKSDGIQTILKAMAQEFEMEYNAPGNTNFELNGGNCN